MKFIDIFKKEPLVVPAFTVQFEPGFLPGMVSYQVVKRTKDEVVAALERRFGANVMAHVQAIV